MKFKVKNISHLFWGKYPYKVTLRIPVRRFTENESWHHRIEAIHKAILDTVKGSKGVKTRQEANTPSYFFMTMEEAQAFIDLNSEVVAELHRPASAAQTVMLADEKLRVRKSLFFGKFRWAVIMRCSYREDGMNEADSWIEDYFELDRPVTIVNEVGKPKWTENDRSRYNYYWTRAIYVNDLADVVAIKLALSQYVKSTLCVVLTTEITD